MRIIQLQITKSLKLYFFHDFFNKTTLKNGYMRIAKKENTKKMYIFHKFRNNPNRNFITKKIKKKNWKSKEIYFLLLHKYLWQEY
tara:strand:- start:8486 stop:8740 length:255 start_codon:yes stop_codon:yes gene_type:complete